jgi:tetratricopeptide (TPR) repeat protein
MLSQLKSTALITLPGVFLLTTVAIAALVHADATPIDHPYSRSNSLVSVANPEKSVTPATPKSAPKSAPKPADPLQQASQHLQQGEQLARSQPEAALRQYEQALALAQSAGHREFEGVIWQRVGQVYADQHDDQQAEAMYQTAIAMARDTDNPYVLSESLAGLADLYDRHKSPQLALDHYRQAAASARLVGNTSLEQHATQRSQTIATALEASALKVAKVAKVAQPSKPQVVSVSSIAKNIGAQVTKRSM